MADNVVFYKGPSHGKSVYLVELPSAIRVPVYATVRSNGEVPQAVYRRTPHMLSGGRRIYQYVGEA